jgi:hypothetical protein
MDVRIAALLVINADESKLVTYFMALVMLVAVAFTHPLWALSLKAV